MKVTVEKTETVRFVDEDQFSLYFQYDPKLEIYTIANSADFDRGIEITVAVMDAIIEHVQKSRV